MPALAIPKPFVSAPNLSGVVHYAHALDDVIWREQPDYHEHWADNDQTCTRVFDVPWYFKDQFTAFALGGAKSGAAEKLSRALPWQHPTRPWLYATAVTLIKGVGATTIDPSFKNMLYFVDVGNSTEGYARLAVTYQSVDYYVLSDAAIVTELDRYVTRNYGYAVEAVSLPGNAFTWAEGVIEPIPAGNSKILHTQQLSYKWHGVPYIPRIAINACVARTNSVGFDTYAATTLLCLPPDIYRYNNDLGNPVVDITYKFVFRDVTWLKIYRGLSGGAVVNDFHLVTPDIYKRADFNTLFA